MLLISLEWPDGYTTSKAHVLPLPLSKHQLERSSEHERWYMDCRMIICISRPQRS